ncbi:flagellar filament capping protein FliD [Caproicibacter sp.]|uniref:flagellar filament capping protein FliD n=1 Tax=Caproicibacter sp. TaxID=2814884 RepID=UPI00398A3FF4
MSSSNSTSSSASLDTSSIYRLSGTNLYSGLDTDKIIKALVSNTQSKIDKQQQLEQIAEWKRDLYRDVTSDMQNFENTYFSYTSDTNLLSPTFFKTADITSSSNAVSATGNTDNAKNLIINSISQMAAQASYNSTQQVSDQEITSGKLYDSWTPSAVGGKSLVVSYNGTDYTLTLSNSVKLDSENMSATDAEGHNVELQKIVDGLNDQVKNNSTLNGKMEFTLNADNSISLASKTSYDVGVKAYTTSKDTTTGQKFLDALGLTKSTGLTINGTAIDTNVSTSGLFNQTIPSSSYLKFNVGGEEYTVSTGVDMTLSGGTDSAYAVAIATRLQKQISANDDLKDKISISSDASTGKITFSSLDGSNLSISGGSQNLLKGLGITTSNTPSGTSVESSGVTKDALFKSYLGDTLAGSTVTFRLDGISKTVTFDALDEADYSSADGISTYLQKKLDSSFGTGKVLVSTESANGTLQFQTGDSTSVLTLSSSSSSNVLGKYGALRVASGETNRVETGKTLNDLAGEFKQTLTAGKYTISINGKELSFDGDTTLSSVISQINSDPDMGVTVAYSQTTDSFRITADDSGSQGKIYYSDVSGNLADTLFGSMSAGTFSSIQSGKLTADNGNVAVSGDAVYSLTLGDTQKTITLASGSYSLSDFQSAVQAQIDSAFGTGSVTVSADTTNGTLSFNAADGKTQLSITSQSTNDPLQISSASNLAGYTAGQDLKMNVTINGTTADVVRSSNTTTLDDVTLTVSGTTDKAVSFSSENNVDDLVSKIVDYVNAYNKIIDKVNTLTTEAQERKSNHKVKYEPLTDDQKKDMTDDEIDKWNTQAKKGLLQNDSALNGILNDLRSAMTDAVKSAGLSLSDLGISTKAYDVTSGGQLVVDTAALKEKLQSNPDAVTSLFTDEDGVSSRVKAALDKYVGTFGGDGVLLLRAGKETDANDTSQLTTQINQYEDTISKLKDQLQTEEDRYWSKFTAMEQSLSTLTSQSNYLTSMLSNNSSSS